MKTLNKIIKKISLITIGLIILSACEREESIQPTAIFENGDAESTVELDQFLKREFRDPYGSLIIYKFVDRYIDPRRSAVPPRIDVVKPIAELIKQAWIEPYNKASDRGEDFLRDFFPGEIVILGSPIFNGDGTVLLGTAEQGVRVTLTDANSYFPGNTEWVLETFRVLHHEFAHIVDQNFNFDVDTFFKISGDDYTSPGTWTQETQNSAIARGMVTPYGTSSVSEDFAELIAFIIKTDPDEFAATYLNPEDCTGLGQDCLDRNIGRARIQEKYDVVVKYMKEDVGVDLLVLRDEFLNSIN